jgi:hypothetical protein
VAVQQNEDASEVVGINARDLLLELPSINY